MANVIKHKRGSGSDPVANDLVVGEVAIRTDVGKLFTKMDNGSVAEIAGGGSDIAINTLSSSSGTGGGSATFNGSAFRFTLSAPPSVSAQQLLVSINGVIQKPVAGTGQPSEGFSVDGTDIILGDAPATGSDFFILTFKSLGVSEPADNSVTSAKIADGAIVNADINASAAIAGTKISPDFGSQAITTTNDSVTIGDSIIHSGDTNTKIRFPSNDIFTVETAGTERIRCDGDGVKIPDRLIHLNDTDTLIRFPSNNTFSVETGGSERLRIDSSGRVGIGTASPAELLHLQSTAGNTKLRLTQSGSSTDAVNGAIHFGNSTDGQLCEIRGYTSGSNNSGFLEFRTTSSGSDVTAMTITTSGNVGMGTSSPSAKLHLFGAGSDFEGLRLTNNLRNDSAASSAQIKFDIRNSGGLRTARIEAREKDDNNNECELNFYTNSSASQNGEVERMTISGTGNVGIGTTSPSGASGKVLEINGGSGQARLVFKNDTTGSASTDGHQIFSDGTTLGIQNREAGSTTFETNGAERMRIDSSGKVGIGTTSPSNGKLHIAHGNEFGLYTSGPFNFQAKFESTDAEAGIVIEDVNSTTDYNRIGVIGNEMEFTVNNSPALRIDSSGNVGIGVTSVSSKLHLDSGGSSTGIQIDSDTESSIDFNDHGGSAIRYRIGTNLSDNNSQFEIRDVTNNASRMRIDSSGNTFVNCTSDPLSQNAKFAVQHGGDGKSVASFDFNQNFARPNIFIKHARAGAVSGTRVGTMIAFQNLNGTTVGTIESGLAGTSYNTSSDYRLKENITKISDGITRIKQLIPKKFSFIGDGDRTLKDGFLAHEVSSVVPEAITGTKDEVDENNEPVYQGIDQSKLVPLLVAALQEAIGRIEALEAK